jgi:2-hydroxychromene-2-carboxylate isomerase
MKELSSEGMWGVPCMKFGEFCVWGQDRLWAIEQEVLTCINASVTNDCE